MLRQSGPFPYDKIRDVLKDGDEVEVGLKVSPFPCHPDTHRRQVVLTSVPASLTD